MFRFETLEIWELGKTYCKKCYAAAQSFPDIEKFALSDQLRRAAISITNNIVEGSGSESAPLFGRYLTISANSVYETVNILIFAADQEYITGDLKDELYREANTLVSKIKSFKKAILAANPKL